ncbi:hypothetical protein ACFVFS_34555 [Kitasatospora sp. NPDC057692]|uniref:DNA polymerase III subunit beta family protein n=1 Tax=Kitasatospora sp. NPDC057692 TaxID=3346215 RepID=UPI0036768F36
MKGKGEDDADPAEEAGRAARTVLVPAKVLSDAAKALAGENPVAIGWSDGQVTLSVPGRSLGTRLLEDEFPKYRNLLPVPDDAELTTTVPVDEALTALKRVALVASDKRPLLTEASHDR